MLSGTSKRFCLTTLVLALRAASYPGMACYHPATSPGALKGQISPSRGVIEVEGSSNWSFMQVLYGTVETFRLAAPAAALQAALYPGIACFHYATGPGGSAGQSSPRTGV